MAALHQSTTKHSHHEGEHEMTKRYTAADFANARFAEHGNGNFAARLNYDANYPWSHSHDEFKDEDMARFGWVPVPTKPTLTDSQLEEACGQWYESDDFLMGFMAGYEKAGGEIIPDPEPTDEELLAGIIRNIDDWQSITSPELLA